MNSIEALLGNQRDTVVRQLAQQFGLNESQASSALGALLPALAAGFQQDAARPSGLESLIGALSSGRHTQYVDDLGALGRPDTIQDGNGILGHIFGSKEVSREVAQRAAAQSGVGADTLKRMLPIVAAIFMGVLAKRQFGGAPAGQGMPGSPMGASVGGGGLLDVLAPMMDRNRDGSMIDDVIGMVGKFMGGR